MKFDYSYGPKDETRKILDGIQALLEHFRAPRLNVDALLKDAAEMIWRQFGISDVSIGLRDPTDGLYRYKVMVGFREDALEAHQKIAYRKDQFFDDSEFKGTDISKYSKIYLSEDNEFIGVERDVFNRPVLLSRKRESLSDSVEGDYIDVKIYGPGEDLLGWIEVSGTRTMTLPDVATIRWIEVIASIVAAALVSQGTVGRALRPSTGA